MSAVHSGVLMMIQVLGGKKVIGQRIESQLDFLPLVRGGLPYESIEALSSTLGLPVDAIAGFLSLPKRTLARRREQNGLDSMQSERVARLARIFVRAVDVLGSAEKAKIWLQRENRALGGLAPISMLDADIGAQAVEDVLGRIEHGVYS